MKFIDEYGNEWNPYMEQCGLIGDENGMFVKPANLRITQPNVNQVQNPSLSEREIKFLFNGKNQNQQT